MSIIRETSIIYKIFTPALTNHFKHNQAWRHFSMRMSVGGVGSRISVTWVLSWIRKHHSSRKLRQHHFHGGPRETSAPTPSLTCIREGWSILPSGGLPVSPSRLRENTTLVCDLIYKWLLALGFPRPQPIRPPSWEISHWVLMYHQSRCYHVVKGVSSTPCCLL